MDILQHHINGTVKQAIDETCKELFHPKFSEQRIREMAAAVLLYRYEIQYDQCTEYGTIEEIENLPPFREMLTNMTGTRTLTLDYYDYEDKSGDFALLDEYKAEDEMRNQR